MSVVALVERGVFGDLSVVLWAGCCVVVVLFGLMLLGLLGLLVCLLVFVGGCFGAVLAV